VWLYALFVVQIGGKTMGVEGANFRDMGNSWSRVSKIKCLLQLKKLLLESSIFCSGQISGLEG
jgi:hypothetical protein